MQMQVEKNNRRSSEHHLTLCEMRLTSLRLYRTHRLETLVVLEPDLGTIGLTVGNFDCISARQQETRAYTHLRLQLAQRQKLHH